MCVCVCVLDIRKFHPFHRHILQRIRMFAIKKLLYNNKCCQVPSLLYRLQCGRYISTIGHNASMDMDLPENFDRKTRIICTVGPSTWDNDGIRKLLDRGMNVLRLNFSHGTHEQKTEVISNLRNIVKDIREEDSVDFSDGSREDFCAIAADTKGPEIRTGLFAGEDVEAVHLKIGDEITISTNLDHYDAGTKDLIYCDYQTLANEIFPGQKIFLDDGLISFVLKEVIDEQTLVCEIENGGKLGQQKGINIPEPFKSNLPSITEQDRKDLEFAADIGVDFIFASFIRSRKDVIAVREALGPNGKNVQIISKVENKEGCDNFDEILQESDGIMVARGDLGIEIPAHTVFLAQKHMISRCNIAGKPVICATQMLESMVENPRPTRAEVSDVANAVLDGADAVMLSGETAKGNFPFKAVDMMSDICKEAEVAIDYDSFFRQIRGSNKKYGIPTNFPMSLETIATSAVVASLEINAPAIVVFSYTGTMVKALAKYRPSCPIFCVTSNKQTANSILLHRGVIPILVPEDDMIDYKHGMKTVVNILKDMKIFSQPQLKNHHGGGDSLNSGNISGERSSLTGGKLVTIGRFDRSRPYDPVMTLV